MSLLYEGFSSRRLVHDEDPRPIKSSMCTENIALPQGVEMSNHEENTEEDEIFLHARLTPSKAYLTDSGASNDMVASRKSFITFPLSRGPSSHMGYESKIAYVERGSDKIKHDEFIPSPT